MENSLQILERDGAMSAVLSGTADTRLISALSTAEFSSIEANVGLGWRGEDLSILDAVPNADRITSITIRCHARGSVRPLLRFRKLKDLTLSYHYNDELDLSVFEDLESLSIEWKRELSGLERLKNLKRLVLVNYGHEYLEVAENLIELQVLGKNLRAVPTGGTNVEQFRIALMKGLHGLEGIKSMQRLRTLEVLSCPIGSIDELAHLSLLETLHLSNCGHIRSLQPLLALRKLRRLTFPESTNIDDGQINVLAQRNVSVVGFRNRKHYDYPQKGEVRE